MNKLFSFLSGLLCGAAVGAVVATLMAPASGSELREMVQTRIEDALAEAQRTQEETAAQLRETYLKEVNRT